MLVRSLVRAAPSRIPWSVNQNPPSESKTRSLGARSGRPSHSVYRSVAAPLDRSTFWIRPPMYWPGSNGPGNSHSPSSSGVKHPPLLHRYTAPSGPIAAPLGPPAISAIVSFEPSGCTRVSRLPNISTRMTEPSGMATGPSGKRRPVVISLMSGTGGLCQVPHRPQRAELRLAFAGGVLQQLVLLDGHQHRACLGTLARADDAGLLEQVHDSTGAGEPDLQFALQHRRRAELVAHHQLHRLTQQRLVLVVVAAGGAEHASPTAAVFLTFHAADVHDLGCLAPPVGDPLAPLFLADERALDSLRHVGVAGKQQHVALADQLLGAWLIEDDAAVGEAVDGICGAGRDVGLDDAGDDVDRRPLCGHDEVHADRAGLLGDTSDALLYVARRDHHQVVEL